jgi:hydrogenase nickel incorporation protein HypA/HybF
MHEVGMCESVLGAVERRAAGRPVAGISVRVGAGLRVVPDAFAQGFELVAVGSVAEGAAVDLTIVPFQIRCRSCGTDDEVLDPLPVCNSCGEVDLDRSGGDDLVLESVRYRAPDGATAGAG